MGAWPLAAAVSAGLTRGRRPAAARGARPWHAAHRAAAAGGLLLAAGLAQPSGAQTLRGRVVDRASGQPIAGAIVSLVTDTTRRWPVLTDGEGAFRLRADSAGTFTVRVDRVGFAPFVQALPVTLASGAVLERTIIVPSSRIELATVRVTANAACAAPGIRGADAARVWEQVKTALASQSLTAQQSLVTLQLTLDEALERGSDPQSFLVRTYRRPTQSWQSQSSRPFVSPRGHDFRRDGFRVALGDSADYFGPDADVALSEAFLATHCFRVVRERRLLRRGGRLGLAFAPLDTTRATFLSGTLWVDEPTSQLTSIDYTYVVPGWPRGVRPPRGTIRFAVLPAGGWIVRDWSMSLPVLSTPVGDQSPRHLATFEKRGSARPAPEAALAPAAPTGPAAPSAPAGPSAPAVVVGFVRDSLLGGPVADVAVRVGGSVVSRTDSSGRFIAVLGDVAPSGQMITVRVEDPLVARLDAAAAERTVSAMPGDTTRLVFDGAGTEAGLARYCPEALRPSDTGERRPIPRGGLLVAVDRTRADSSALVVRMSWEVPGGSTRWMEVPLAPDGVAVGCPVASDRTVTLAIADESGPRGVMIAAPTGRRLRALRVTLSPP